MKAGVFSPENNKITPMLYDMKILSPYPDNRNIFIKKDLTGLKYDEKSSSFKRIQFNHYPPLEYLSGRMINFENNDYKNIIKNKVEFSSEASVDESESSSI
mgnify:CR=1 FL=1